MHHDNQPCSNPAGAVCAHSVSHRMARALWNVVWICLFRPSPRCLWRWRLLLLRIFGAKVGNAHVHSAVKIWAPWLLRLGSEIWIDARVRLYNPFGIEIQDRNVISEGAFLCTATHDYTIPNYPLTGKLLTVESDCWIAAEAFISPSVGTIGRGAVVGARAVVVKPVPAWAVVGGNPAKFIKAREIHDESSVQL